MKINKVVKVDLDKKRYPPFSTLIKNSLFKNQVMSDTTFFIFYILLIYKKTI
jgi:hypothetical protein